MKIHKKKIFQMKNQYMTQKKKNLSKILINFIKIQNLTLTFKTSLFQNVLECSRNFYKIPDCFRIFYNFPKYPRKFRNVPEFLKIFRNILEGSRSFWNIPECS